MRPVYKKFPGVVGQISPGTNVTSGWIPLDIYIAPGNVAVTMKATQVGASAPTGTISLFFTNDDVFDAALLGVFAAQPYTATPFSTTGSWPLAGFTGDGSIAVVEAMFAYAPRAVQVDLNLTAGTVNFEVQVIQMGIGGT